MHCSMHLITLTVKIDSSIYWGPLDARIFSQRIHTVALHLVGKVLYYEFSSHMPSLAAGRRRGALWNLGMVSR